MPESDISRRGFFTAMAGIIGGIIGVAIGVPAIAYLLDPAFKSSAKEAWIPIGKLADMQGGQAISILIHARPSQRLGTHLHQPWRVCHSQIGEPNGYDHFQ